MLANLKKAVIVVYREENAEDFQQIARRVKRLDSSLGVAMVPEFLTSKMVPPEFLQLPLLVIYLCNPPETEFAIAAKIAVKEMSKIEEYEHFKRNNLPCLPIERFRWGMELDPKIYGDWVVLKPEHIQSTGKDVNMVSTKLIPTLTIQNFPEEHLIRQDSYLVQNFIKCGETPTHFRVTVFLNEVLFSSRARSKLSYPKTDSSLMLNTTVASNMRENRSTQLFQDEEINNFARMVANAFPQNPLLGIDILKDDLTGKLYVLEVNLGGNTWHFSSLIGEGYRFDLGGRNAMVRQYNAWDKAASALVRKTHELAK
ncbi:hypothetical protein [Candidatus Methylopumilus turicensis]|uniref:ATP-grasp domain-containing protein n=1 Tax=Candidatus Methylopumilus turicensis TaxID=1581680 RepID=A0A0B7IWV3_9PROT|nr:hypothetical protein [Candidatus Methylopumilus turicensis]CEN56681.1 conserved protein of unknown function [Candidatus Methylopumilus turicensis]